MNIKVIVSILFTITFCSISAGQSSIEYKNLKQYKNWGIVFGPSIYNKAKLTPQYGDYTIKSLPILGYALGFEYNFHPEKQWSFSTGFTISQEPVNNLKFNIKSEDLYPHYTSDFEEHFKSYSVLSFSIPLILSINKKLGKILYGNLRTGLKYMYYQTGTSYTSLTINNEEMTEVREVFGLMVSTQDKTSYGSFIVGAGFSLALKKFLLKANVIYVMNFQSTIIGEYQIANLFVSPDTRGDYELSGNYLSLLFTVHFNKLKNKRDVW